MTDPDPLPLPQHSPFTVVERREVYRNPWTVVLEDRLVDDEGHPGLYGYLAEKSFAIVCALDGDDRVALVRQWRHAFGCATWELPCGACDPDEDPLDTARRELAEETGLAAASLIHLGSFHHSDARVAGRGHAYLARGLEALATTPRSDASETDLITTRIPFTAALRACDEGRLANVASAWVLYRVARYLGSRG